MKTINAKEEFLKVIGNYKLIAANVSFGELHQSDTIENFKLKPLYTKEEYNNFLTFLDREYYNGFGSQELYGLIYCEDGVWIKREEYDGSEWWVVVFYPDLNLCFDDADILKYERFKKLNKLNKIF